MGRSSPAGEPVEQFKLSTGHDVRVFRPGELGMPVYADHEIVLIEDAGSPAATRLAAEAAVAYQQSQKQ